jgi:hypothetical protein
MRMRGFRFIRFFKCSHLPSLVARAKNCGFRTEKLQQKQEGGNDASAEAMFGSMARCMA